MLSEKQLKDAGECGKKATCYGCGLFDVRGRCKKELSQEVLTYRNILKELLPDVANLLNSMHYSFVKHEYEPSERFKVLKNSVEEIQTQLKESEGE